MRPGSGPADLSSKASDLSNVVSLAGRFDAAALEALCVDNAAPEFGEIKTAKDQMTALVLAVSELIADHPVRPSGYVREQSAFRPVCDLMRRSGWTFCGSGYYSAAFYRNGLAMKIGFKPEDSGLMYAAWCRANQRRAGVPIVHKLLSKGLCYAVLMDRLEAIAGELSPGDPMYDPQLAAEVDSVKETINLGIDGWGRHMDLCRTAIDIREFFSDIANFDIHEANVMLDRYGNVVITDPVSFVGDYQSFAPSSGDVSTYRRYG
jgi:hypothetical protein